MEWNGGVDYWSGVLDWITGVPRPQVHNLLGCLYSVEWNGGMERWNGTVEWNSGMERWNGIVEWNGGIVE